MFAKLTLPPGCTMESVSDTEIVVRIPDSQLPETAFLHVVTLENVGQYVPDPSYAKDSGVLEAHHKGNIQWGRDAVFHGRTRFELPNYDFIPWTVEDRTKGEPPVSAYSEVVVKLRNGVIEGGRAERFYWAYHAEPWGVLDIVGYTVTYKD